VNNRDPRHVAREFVKMWVAHYGVPELVLAAQGGEFSSHFT